MHLGSGGPGAEIVLGEIDMYTGQYGTCSSTDRVDTRTPQGFGVQIDGTSAHWCDPDARVFIDTLSGPTRALIDEIRVQRVDNTP